MCYAQFLADLLLVKPFGVDMAFFEQASLLATAWANNEDLRALGAKHSLCVIRSRQLSRRHLHARNVYDASTVSFSQRLFFVKSCIGRGDITRNCVAVGTAVSKLGMRASQGMLEQAVYQFFSLCLPRGHEICSPLTSMRALVFRYRALHAFKETCFQGTKHKMQSRVIKKLMYKFSRIAKIHACTV